MTSKELDSAERAFGLIPIIDLIEKEKRTMKDQDLNFPPGFIEAVQNKPDVKNPFDASAEQVDTTKIEDQCRDALNHCRSAIECINVLSIPSASDYLDRAVGKIHKVRDTVPLILSELTRLRTELASQVSTISALQTECEELRVTRAEFKKKVTDVQDELAAARERERVMREALAEAPCSYCNGFGRFIGGPGDGEECPFCKKRRAILSATGTVEGDGDDKARLSAIEENGWEIVTTEMSYGDDADFVFNIVEHYIGKPNKIIGTSTNLRTAIDTARKQEGEV